MMTFWILLGLLGLLILFIWTTYNGLVTARERVEESWSGIDVQLKRRASLIPNLIETVKGYAKHEKELLENVTKARSALVNADHREQKAAANDVLSGMLKSVFALAEAYPDLKANENFKELQEELSDTETKIAASRQFYNTNVLDLNTKVQMFPAVLIANMFSFKQTEFFKATEEEKKEIEVKF